MRSCLNRHAKAIGTEVRKDDGESSHQARLKTNATLVPPNANELLIA